MKFFPGKKYLVAILLIVLAFLYYAMHVYSPVIYKIDRRYANFIKTTIPDGLTSLSSKECGTCHIEIYNEWKSSMHAKAYVDPFYQAYLKKDNNHWTCYYCHTPLERQREYKIIGFVKNDLNRPILDVNPDFDEELRDEGVTCAGCHVKDGIIYGPFGGLNAPHPTAYDASLLSTDLCERCHEVPKASTMFYKGNPCGSVEEFNNGPYKEDGYTCQTCHMPATVRRLTPTSSEFRPTRRHTFAGPHSKDMLKKALYVTIEKENGKGKEKFTLKVLNNGAGHKVPTGDPDRYINIITKFYDSDNLLITKEIETLKRVILYYPIIIEFSDNRLKPLMERTYTYDNKDALTRAKSATVEIEYHILTDRAKKKLVKKYGLDKDTKKIYKVAPVRFEFN
ncbi:multiheme c-type cytochrome [Thermodesulfobacteriota bacterium]